MNQNGPITVEPSAAGGQVEVRAERIARSSSDEAAKELLKKIEIREDVTATACPRRNARAQDVGT